MRLQKPKSTVLIFDSGKAVCVGIKDPKIMREAFYVCAKIIRDVGFKAKTRNIKVHNFVASWDMGSGIRVIDFCKTYPIYSSYKPELFPGCIYTVSKTSNSKIMIFTTGKVYMTGVRTRNNMNTLYIEISKCIKPFLKENYKYKSMIL